jgi:hypothetical protein
MDIPRTTFKKWRTRHLQELKRDYRQYLADSLDDEGFDITHVEDFDAWTREEYEILHASAQNLTLSAHYRGRDVSAVPAQHLGACRAETAAVRLAQGVISSCFCGCHRFFLEAVVGRMNVHNKGDSPRLFPDKNGEITAMCVIISPLVSESLWGCLHTPHYAVPRTAQGKGEEYGGAPGNPTGARDTMDRTESHTG